MKIPFGIAVSALMLLNVVINFSFLLGVMYNHHQNRTSDWWMTYDYQAYTHANISMNQFLIINAVIFGVLSYFFDRWGVSVLNLEFNAIMATIFVQFWINIYLWRQALPINVENN